MRKAGIRACLKKVWVTRLEATGVLATLEEREADGDVIDNLEKIWRLDNPPRKAS